MSSKYFHPLLASKTTKVRNTATIILTIDCQFCRWHEVSISHQSIVDDTRSKLWVCNSVKSKSDTLQVHATRPVRQKCDRIWISTKEKVRVSSWYQPGLNSGRCTCILMFWTCIIHAHIQSGGPLMHFHTRKRCVYYLPQLSVSVYLWVFVWVAGPLSSIKHTLWNTQTPTRIRTHTLGGTHMNLSASGVCVCLRS